MFIPHPASLSSSMKTSPLKPARQSSSSWSRFEYPCDATVIEGEESNPEGLLFERSHHTGSVDVVVHTSRTNRCTAQAGLKRNGSSRMDDKWEVMWCYVGWFEVADRLEAMLPAWATLRRMDPSLPLAEQVVSSDVLIPTTGTVDEAVIRAATRCKLIAQPAAGTDCIALDVAKQLGIPVTNAPGETARTQSPLE